MTRRPRRSPLFPSTPLSRSGVTPTGDCPAPSTSPRSARLFLGREPQPLLQHEPHLLRGRTPEGAAGRVVFDLDLLPVLGHRGLLLVLRRDIHSLGPDPNDLGGRGVRPPDPARASPSLVGGKKP